MTLSKEEWAREEKIIRHRQGDGEEIFELSNSLCEGGCCEFLTEDEEDAGWGMCMECKLEAMK
jgi:hypothetical protein